MKDIIERYCSINMKGGKESTSVTNVLRML